MVGDGAGFVTIPVHDKNTAAWNNVPPSWELHGQLGSPTSLIVNRKVDGPTLLPCYYIENPFLVTNSRQTIDLSGHFHIKFPVNQIGKPLREGFVVEPNLRDIEL